MNTFYNILAIKFFPNFISFFSSSSLSLYFSSSLQILFQFMLNSVFQHQAKTRCSKKMRISLKWASNWIEVINPHSKHKYNNLTISKYPSMLKINPIHYPTTQFQSKSKTQISETYAEAEGTSRGFSASGWNENLPSCLNAHSPWEFPQQLFKIIVAANAIRCRIPKREMIHVLSFLSEIRL